MTTLTTGTEKQIATATAIIATVSAKLVAVREMAATMMGGADPAMVAAFTKHIDLAAEKLSTATDAGSVITAFESFAKWGGPKGGFDDIAQALVYRSNHVALIERVR